jgi:hypothetical protein
MKGRLGKTLEVMESGIPSDTKLLNLFVVGRLRSGVAVESLHQAALARRVSQIASSFCLDATIARFLARAGDVA